MTKICYWDAEEGVQKERDMTPTEEAEIASRAQAMPTQGDYVNAVQGLLDTKAQERRYYNILSACTYATSTNATFQAEAQACLSWRDAVWAKCYSVLDQVGAGTLAQPTIPELLAMLPTMTWPT